MVSESEAGFAGEQQSAFSPFSFQQPISSLRQERDHGQETAASLDPEPKTGRKP